jgi:NADH-quinone oxidoreductase subunit B
MKILNNQETFGKEPQIIGESWVTTRFEDLEDWAQRNSFWPFPFGTACCAIEFMSTLSSHYDVARFGSEVVRFSPRQSDVLLVAGTINDKMGPVLKRIYDQMADPKWVISMGACACSGGFYRAYHVMQGIDEIIPVDVYVPGCPPTPEGLIYGILQLKERVSRDRKKFRARVAGDANAAKAAKAANAANAAKASDAPARQSEEEISDRVDARPASA